LLSKSLPEACFPNFRNSMIFECDIGHLRQMPNASPTRSCALEIPRQRPVLWGTCKMVTACSTRSNKQGRSARRSSARARTLLAAVGLGSVTLNPSLIEAAPPCYSRWRRRSVREGARPKVTAKRSGRHAELRRMLAHFCTQPCDCKILPGVATPSGCIYIRSTAFPRFRCGAPVGEVRHGSFTTFKKRGSRTKVTSWARRVSSYRVHLTSGS
jgi:hypothetical protein